MPVASIAQNLDIVLLFLTIYVLLKLLIIWPNRFFKIILLLKKFISYVKSFFLSLEFVE